MYVSCDGIYCESEMVVHLDVDWPRSGSRTRRTGFTHGPDPMFGFRFINMTRPEPILGSGSNSLHEPEPEVRTQTPKSIKV